MSAPGYSSYAESQVERLGKLPSHWKVVALKRVATLTYGDALATDVRAAGGQIAVYGSNGPVGLHDEPNTEAPVIFIGRKGSCGALNWSEVAGFAIDTVYFVDQRTSRVSLRWLYWLLHTLGLEHSSQDTGVPGLARATAHAARVPWPTPLEQVAIAAFLDRETGKIDALVEAQRRLIELLKEKRQAVISHAVTKGLDPAAPMKDSGVEWLGEVPAHWEVVPMRAGLLERVEKNTNAANQNYLSLVAGRGVMPYAEKGDIGNKKPEDLSKCKTVYDGDIVINSMNFGIGSFGLSRYSGVCSPVYVVLHARDSSLFIEFAAALLATKSLQTFAQSFGNGILAHRSAIGWDELKVIPIGLPSREEQSRILAHIQSVNHRAQLLLAEADAAITLLQERRSALISAAVTGKIDVRSFVPEQTEAA